MFLLVLTCFRLIMSASKGIDVAAILQKSYIKTTVIFWIFMFYSKSILNYVFQDHKLGKWGHQVLHLSRRTSWKGDGWIQPSMWTKLDQETTSNIVWSMECIESLLLWSWRKNSLQNTKVYSKFNFSDVKMTANVLKNLKRSDEVALSNSKYLLFSCFCTVLSFCWSFIWCVFVFSIIFLCFQSIFVFFDNK